MEFKRSPTLSRLACVPHQCLLEKPPLDSLISLTYNTSYMDNMQTLVTTLRYIRPNRWAPLPPKRKWGNYFAWPLIGLGVNSPRALIDG